MLKITLHDRAEALTLQVEGKLIGPWAKELEQAWKRARAMGDRKARIVDLRETLYIDGEGKRVLAELFHEGAFFQTCGAMTTSIVDEITGKRRNSRRRVVMPVLMLILAAGITQSRENQNAARFTLLPQINFVRATGQMESLYAK